MFLQLVGGDRFMLVRSSTSHEAVLSHLILTALLVVGLAVVPLSQHAAGGLRLQSTNDLGGAGGKGVVRG